MAEDSEVNRMVALGMLEKLGCRAGAVANGREAVEAVERGDYDVVLMDLQMPDMDGLSATAFIREGEARAGGHTPIIALTAHAMRGDRQRCLDAVMEGYLEKPVRPRALFDSLTSWARRPGPVAQKAPRRSGPLADLCNGDWEAERAILEIGRAEIARLMAGLRSSLEGADLPALGPQAHTLKGAAAMIGALGLAGLCTKIEAAARGDDLPREHDAFAKMRLEWDRFGADLGHRLSSR